jgi:glycosyltransferase involved in cell wall biosynthesis
MNVLIIVPAYNEEDSILAVANDIRKHCPQFETIVINDGSRDNTAAVARSIGLNVIDLPLNIGIGGAVQTGFIYAVRNNFDIAVQFDGDGQHQAKEIETLINPILKGDADMVIGSRFLNLNSNFKSTWLRRVGIRYFQYLNHAIIGKKITDCTSGFRAYNRKAIKILADHYPEDYPEPEAVVTMAKNGIIIKEVPTQMIARKEGVSSIKGITSAYYMIKVSIAIIVESLKPCRYQRG